MFVVISILSNTSGRINIKFSRCLEEVIMLVQRCVENDKPLRIPLPLGIIPRIIRSFCFALQISSVFGARRPAGCVVDHKLSINSRQLFSVMKTADHASQGNFIPWKSPEILTRK
jgi:hypothetical protein